MLGLQAQDVLHGVNGGGGHTGAAARIGPYARIRPDTTLGNNVHIDLDNDFGGTALR